MVTKNRKKYEILTLKNIFNDGSRIFRIPDYQRGYSWETEQRNDLIKDIEYVINSGYKYRHYTGTIVASVNKKMTNKFGMDTYDIVDGQQRLTTLVILISVICNKLKDNKKKNEDNNNEIYNTFIATGEEKGNTKRKFITGIEQDGLFEKLILRNDDFTKEIESKSDQNLVDAFNEFKKWINNENINNVLKCLENYVGFLFYAPENTKEIGIMFEVINNRGKTLSQLEKIKNYLIYFSNKNDIKDIKNSVKLSWPKILKNLNIIDYTSNDDENSFLRNCWIVFKDINKKKSYHVYIQMKEKWPPDNIENWSEINKFVNFIERASVTYKKLFNDHINMDMENIWLERIKYHPQNASVIPLILAIYEKIKNYDEKVEILELIEKVNFRYYGSGIANRSDSGQGHLFWLAWMLYNREYDENNKKIDFNWIKFKLIDFTKEEANDKKFIQYLTLDKDESGDYYHWIGLKFFLASYEEKIREGKKESSNLKNLLAIRKDKFPNDFYHKEHIWAAGDRTKYFDKDTRNVNKRRLANFILLKALKNEGVSNKPPENKIEELYNQDKNGKPSTYMIKELRQWFEKAKIEPNKKWTKKTHKYWYNVYQRFLDMREEKLVNFALERWRIEDLKDNIDYVRINSLKDENEIYEFNNS